MSQTLFEIIGIGLLILIVVAGILSMKSPSKGANVMGAVMEEIQKVMEPQAGQIREAKTKSNHEEKQRKNGEGGRDA